MGGVFRKVCETLEQQHVSNILYTCNEVQVRLNTRKSKRDSPHETTQPHNRAMKEAQQAALAHKSRPPTTAAEGITHLRVEMVYLTRHGVPA